MKGQGLDEVPVKGQFLDEVCVKNHSLSYIEGKYGTIVSRWSLMKS